MNNLTKNSFLTNLKDNKTAGGIEGFLKQNGSTVSMVAGFVTLGLCIWRAYKASGEVSKIQENYIEAKQKIAAEGLSEPQKKAKMKEIRSERNTKFILAYKWVWLFGGSTLGFMLLSQYLNGIAFTALAGYAMKEEDKVKQFVKKGKEVLGEEKFKEVEDKVLEEQIDQRNSIDGVQRLILENENNEGIIVVDSKTGAIAEFQDEKELIGALEGGEKYCVRNHGLTQEKFLSNCGFDYSSIPFEASQCGWTADHLLKTYIGTRVYKGAVLTSIEYASGHEPILLAKTKDKDKTKDKGKDKIKDATDGGTSQ